MDNLRGPDPDSDEALTNWLLGLIGQDASLAEAAAIRTGSRSWRPGADEDPSDWDESDVHVTRWDPDRVINREVVSNRLIVVLHENHDGFCKACREPMPCRTKCLMALRYDNEPGYDPRWIPS